MRSEAEVRTSLAEWQREAEICLANNEARGIAQAAATIRTLKWVLAELKVN